MHLNLTLEQAQIVGEALNFYRSVQEWNFHARASTREEKGEAQRRLRLLDEVQTL